MTALRNELNVLAVDLRSEKLNCRNKAAERLDTLLGNYRTEIVSILKGSKQDNQNVSLGEIFNSVIEATTQHAIKVDQTQDPKALQTIRNKNYVFRGLIEKIIDCNLEKGNNFLSAGIILTAFNDGLSNKSIVKQFGLCFLNLLDRGIYKSNLYTSNLKITDYKKILSLLFELNVFNDEILRFDVLRSLVKTIELAIERVQIGSDLSDYMPELRIYAHRANDERRRSDVMKLCNIFVKEIGVNYRRSVCAELQALLPIISDYYSVNLKRETKIIFFQLINDSMNLIYPFLNKGDFDTLNVELKGDWCKLIKKLYNVIEAEIKNRNLSLQRRSQNPNDDQTFVLMSSKIIYLLYWHLNKSSESSGEDNVENKRKMAKQSDNLEYVIGLALPKSTVLNELWFSILTCLLESIENIINCSNYLQLMQTIHNIYQMFLNSNNFRNVRICLKAILTFENSFDDENTNYRNPICDNIWLEIIKGLLEESTSNVNNEEKQQILQSLIQNNRLTADNCTTLIRTIIGNSTMRRVECIKTLRTIFVNADKCNFDKTSILIEQVLKWCYEETSRIDAKSILLNVTPIDTFLMADTCALAIINLLSDVNSSTSCALSSSSSKLNGQLESSNLHLLSFKSMRKLICLEQYVQRKERNRLDNINVSVANNVNHNKNCLFQSQYEILMRLLSYETSKEINFTEMRKDLNALYKFVCIMKSFLQYQVFNASNYIQCPLIKRIGLFLSQLELQMKTNTLNTLENSDMVEIAQHLEEIFIIFTSDVVLLNYLERQPLEETIIFIGDYLNRNDGLEKNSDVDNESHIKYYCMHTLSLLCASSSHCHDAFKYIQMYKFNSSSDVDMLLKIIRTLTLHQHMDQEIASYCVNVIRNILKIHHTDIKIVKTIIQLLPGICNYVQTFEESLQDMFLVLMSLLKLSFKGAYSSQMTAELIENFHQIVKYCSTNFDDENFVNLCLSIAKFFSFQSFDIQLSTVNTLISLLDKDWLNIQNDGTYFEFCTKLITYIDLKKLPMTTEDLTENSRAITVQFLLSLFAFSSYFKNAALEELLYYCALYKLTEDDMKIIEEIEKYYECSMKDLTQFYTSDLIHNWAKKAYPMTKFPYFLVCRNKQEFFMENQAIISFCFLIYYEDDEKRSKNLYGNNKENTLQLSYPLAYIHILPYITKSNQMSAFEPYMEKLINDYKKHGMNITKWKEKGKIDWRIVYYCINLMRDNDYYKEMFTSAIYYKEVKWFNIDYSTLVGCLNHYLNEVYGLKNNAICIELLAIKEPEKLVDLFGKLKENCLNSVFSEDKKLHLLAYCAIVDLLLTSFHMKIEEINTSVVIYFLTDIICFFMQYLTKDHSIDIQLAALTFLNRIIAKYLQEIEHLLDIIKEHLSYITKTLIDLCELTTNDAISNLCINILRLIFCNSSEMKKEIALLNQFPNTEKFEELRALQHTSQNSDEKPDFVIVINNFLQKKYITTEDLKSTRSAVSSWKDELQVNSRLLHNLIGRLMHIIRNNANNTKVETKIEAAKLLGEIGPLKIKNKLYYFQAEHTEYENDWCKDEATNYFVHSMLNVFDKILLEFNVKTYVKVHEVIKHLANSKYTKPFEDSFNYIAIFKSKNFTSCIDDHLNVPTIDWLKILQTTSIASATTRATASTARRESIYEEWICLFVSNVFKQCDWLAFSELATYDYHFADAVLQPFIKLIISTNELHFQNLLQMIDYYFNEWYKMNTTSALFKNNIYSDKTILTKCLNICECLRINNNWMLPINMLKVAKACNYCQAYFMSVMYLEIWALNAQSRDNENTSYDIMANEDFQNIATEAYKWIGCSEAIAGFLDPLRSRIDYLNLDNNWSDILIESESFESMSNDLYGPILKRNGMFGLAGNGKLNENIDYEVLWRLCRWDHTVENNSKVNLTANMSREFEKHHYNALKCLHNIEENNTKTAVANARECVLYILKDISFECLQSVYKYMTCLQFLQHIEDFIEIQFRSGTSVNDILEKWTTEFDLDYGSFDYKEQVLSHQITLFRLAGIRASRKIKDFYKEDPITRCMLKCIKECRKAGQINLAKRNISLLRQMSVNNEQIKINVLLEDAEICMQTDKPQITKAILYHILKNSEYAYCLDRVKAFRMQGEFLMETRGECFESVVSTFFKASMDLLDKLDKSQAAILQKYPDLFDAETFQQFKKENVKATYETIAKYADREYTQLNNYMSSTEFQMKNRIMEKNREAAESIGKAQDRDKNVGAAVMKKFANLDQKEFHSYEEKRTDNLCMAIENYMKFCEIDETISSPAIYRIIALWFTNKQNDKLHTKIKENLLTIPTYKFICALNQITARLNSTNLEFKQLLKDLLIRCVQEHPQQTLYQLYSLVYAFKDGKIDKKHDRINIAKEIITKSKTKKTMEIIKQMDALFIALIEFANYNESDRKITTMKLSDKLQRLKNLNHIQCPTMALNIAKNLEYKYTSVVKWHESVSMVGGINAPKKLICLCSDGKQRPQLLKGKDDLRQDAVMQQVFAMINDLLKHSTESASKNLSLRTYKVLPLSMRSGILEWCENTSVIGRYLLEAHKQYRPNDYSCSKCRQLAMHHLKSNSEMRYKIYMQICENIKPVFHYFLYEKYATPGVWFERRMAYTNSVATTSIVGYILGLGDRHTQNILVDQTTAELIHIDFGIAFEQGKIMPTPETVPFRLTRDMVAPMGIAETSGSFKKACDTTMQILRNHQTIITTILEVLLYDPLYMWKIVPHQDNREPNAIEEDSTEQNLTAQRALICVQNKLEGKQNRIIGVADVSVQVQRLINQAVSNRNLCLMYPGWDAYL